MASPDDPEAAGTVQKWELSLDAIKERGYRMVGGGACFSCGGDSPKIGVEEFWDLLKESDEKHFLMGAGVREVDDGEKERCEGNNASYIS